MPGRFSVGDRVAIHSDPRRCGMVTEVPDEGVYIVTWDGYVIGRRTENELVPCTDEASPGDD